MKAVMKNVTIDDANADLVAFAQTIDFTELFDYIKIFANVDCRFCQPEITTDRGDVYISFLSDDITKQTGVFAAIFERCYIYSFIDGVFKDKDTGEPGYWVSVNIRFEHKAGGACGIGMISAGYRNGQWTFFEKIG